MDDKYFIKPLNFCTRINIQDVNPPIAILEAKTPLGAYRIFLREDEFFLAYPDGKSASIFCDIETAKFFANTHCKSDGMLGQFLTKAE